jgi:ankyrin repeat protein
MGVNFNSQDIWGATPLYLAAESGHEAVMKLLLSTHAVDVDLADNQDHTPLLAAVRRKDEAIVKLLLDTNPVNVESKTSYGDTSLSTAVQGGDDAVVKLLLDTGKVDFNFRNYYSYGWSGSLLDLATERGYGKILELLLGAGAVPSSPSDSD